ncbi:MAG: polysaccharide deacetylase family protein [Acidimicrobiales bacterium]
MRASTGVFAVSVLAIAALGIVQLSTRADKGVAVEIDGRSVPLEGKAPTVADAIAEADVPMPPGAIRAAVSGRVLVAEAHPATVTVNGTPATLDTRVRRNDKVAVVPGADTVEPVDERRVEGTPPGLPDVERSLYISAKAKIDVQVVGRMSGEVVSTMAVDPGSPAVPVTDKVVALTFDDGPDPKFTPDVMKILAEEGVKATFCVIGSASKRHADMAQSQIAAGHARCNHTIDHAHLPRLSHDGVVNQIKGATDILTPIDGGAPRLFRPPYGELSADAIAVAHEAGMRVLTWNVDSEDYNKPSPERIVSNVMGAVKPGSVVLLHDGGGDRAGTVAALRPLIKALRAQGYSFATPVPTP